uniref:Uncharacterized protein n=1 Tax=Anguilla anguilla TaxID=7936 RepID=A0A0E9QRD3_ANGAN
MIITTRKSTTGAKIMVSYILKRLCFKGL